MASESKTIGNREYSVGKVWVGYTNGIGSDSIYEHAISYRPINPKTGKPWQRIRYGARFATEQEAAAAFDALTSKAEA